MLPKSTTRKIPLSQGEYATVDKEDYEWLTKWKWACQTNGYGDVYASRFTSRKLGKRKCILMHRLIARARRGEVTDHINHDTLDNRRGNLRVVTQSENLINRSKLPSTNTSGFLGVSWAKWIGKWSAQITVKGKNKFLGHFDDPRKAALARDRATIRYFGNPAFLNFPEESSGRQKRSVINLVD